MKVRVVWSSSPPPISRLASKRRLKRSAKLTKKQLKADEKSLEKEIDAASNLAVAQLRAETAGS